MEENRRVVVVKNEDKSDAAGGGVGVAGLLGVLFVGLKLTGYIDWSWFWVTAPFWMPFAFIAVVLVIAVILMLIKACIE